ncbi:hypothetical protein [Flagellimonas algicola]|uniref:Uncharacterized protein n=1 Tax=Flagellimonas algicola TaxID=2583815 RepID=A0ABY2WNL6_9FLAO|nr:hypothetical protein [Allomuricauda algicola]TMU56483.1 hypothetical protein FGG15_02790 [Allomuricauda algicola]
MESKLVKENAWRNMHLVLHGNGAIFKSIDSTKNVIKNAWQRVQDGFLDLEGEPLSKGLIDCINFYGEYKRLLDD